MATLSSADNLCKHFRAGQIRTDTRIEHNIMNFKALFWCHKAATNLKMSSAANLPGKRKLVALHSLSSWCLVAVVYLPRGAMGLSSLCLWYFLIILTIFMAS